MNFIEMFLPIKVYRWICQYKNHFQKIRVQGWVIAKGLKDSDEMLKNYKELKLWQKS